MLGETILPVDRLDVQTVQGTAIVEQLAEVLLYSAEEEDRK